MLRAAYYNEIDPYAAQWLRNLIAAGHIAAGDVDERSIVDVRSSDLCGFSQVHFFAGIGGWSAALRYASWPDESPVWTGSCPCQSLSVAGQRKGHADKRHLWPAFYRLIAERRPPIVFGEQVAGTDGLEWLAGVRADLEAAGYACGAADLPAASVAAPHKRHRLYWMAHAHGGNASAEGLQRSRQQRQQPKNGFDPEGMGNAESEPLRRRGQPWQSAVAIRCDDGSRRIEPGILALVDGIPNRLAQLRAYGNAIVPQVAAEFIRAAQP